MALKPADWQAIETVLLDMDGTLLDLHFDNYFWLTHLPEVYSRKQGISVAQANDFLFDLMGRIRGSIEWYCLDYWSSTLDLDIATMKLDVAHKIALRPFAREFVQTLQNQGKHVVLLTNAHRGSLSLKMQRTALDEHFDRLISTHDYGVPKEDQRLWDALKADCAYDPESTLLIDDTETVLQSAHDYGIAYLLTIKQPDSMHPPRLDLKFPAIDHFDEVMPHG
ncbi:GMP/IMP nucleotidase YrfG [BD1-7 clade bacterium]|uniref:GMP/IMP nucleotidase YrfG n=1 Tax=BD1-7 clade bacterium TaxID=2029982 RepID=A0A5S9N4G7_9GAMM|nr:GMP/IMP nucleotidase YrfG [BD1-7 clade bacterium]CAA0083757.1 GMP/IMP nucleotidase YrfG [BD1-7 clade bacterium]